MRLRIVLSSETYVLIHAAGGSHWTGRGSPRARNKPEYMVCRKLPWSIEQQQAMVGFGRLEIVRTHVYTRETKAILGALAAAQFGQLSGPDATFTLGNGEE